MMTGLEVEIMSEFAKREGITVEYKSTPFATVLTGVQSSGTWPCLPFGLRQIVWL